MQRKHLVRFVAAVLVMALGGGAASASSHSDAPLIKLDPQANLTDVYAFIGTSAAGVPSLNVLVAVHPFCQAGDGGEYDKFSDSALYSINIADPTTGAIVIRYDFQFSPVSSALGNFKNKDTILLYGQGTGLNVGAISKVGGPHQNYTQMYTVTKTTFSGGTKSTQLGANLLVPPPNPGSRVTPSYNGANKFALNFSVVANTFANLDALTKQSVNLLASGESVFSGLRDDCFFGDVPAIFDLLNSRILGTDGHGQTPGNGYDGFRGFNTLVYGIQIPLTSLPSLSYTLPAILGGTQTGVGVYASVSRPRITLRSSTSDPFGAGGYIQVNRLANPLFNEVLVNIVDKDNYNRTSPTVDANMFQKYANAPVVIVLINAVFGTSFVTTGRADLVAIYIPDVIRVNTTTGAVLLPGQAGFSRLSIFGGDTVKDAKGNTVPGGWPNGRRPGDDTIDIALTAIASGPAYTSIFLLGDNVNANDQMFNLVFPYLSTPQSGTHNSTTPPDNVGGP